VNDNHVALIVEDDPLIIAILKNIVTSLGHGYIVATNLEEVRAAIAKGGYCYVLLDMQIPADATSDPSVGCGQTALKLLRRAAPGRTAAGKHVLPILVVTSYSSSPHFVSKMFEMDADAFLPKPFEELDVVLDKVRALLERAEREDHDDCLCPAVSPPAAPAEPVRTTPSGDAGSIRLTIDGQGAAGRTFVVVNGKRVSLQNGGFDVFFRLVAAHVRTPGAWVPSEKLGVATRGWLMTRVRRPFKEALPAGVELIETEKGSGYRLNPGVVVEKVAAEALLRHGQAAVRKIAGEWGRK